LINTDVVNTYDPVAVWRQGFFVVPLWKLIPNQKMKFIAASLLREWSAQLRRFAGRSAAQMRDTLAQTD